MDDRQRSQRWSRAAPIDTRAARADTVIRAVAAAAVGAGLLLVTYWWVAGGGVSDLASWATGLMSAGRLTGLVASDLLLVQVLLMARLPPVERAVGQDRLARWHRWSASAPSTSCSPTSSLITWGYAAGDLAAVPGDVLGPDGHLPRHAARRSPGTVCLVMVVVTSVRAARQPAALRVVAPAAPLRLPRRRAGAAAPAVDRAGVPLLPRRAPSTGGRCGPPPQRPCSSAGSGCRCTARCATACA